MREDVTIVISSLVDLNRSHVTWGNRLETDPFKFCKHARNHGDFIKWKHFPRYWPFVRGIHRSPVNSQHKGQWRGALMFSLIYTWTNGWVNNNEAGDLRRHRTHHDLSVMTRPIASLCDRYPGITGQPNLINTSVTLFLVVKAQLVFLIRIILIHKWNALFTTSCKLILDAGRWQIRLWGLSRSHLISYVILSI